MPIVGSLGGSSAFSFGKIASKLTASIEYLVIAGGGGASHGGGGAGGYRCNVSGENSGGTSSPESSFFPSANQPLTITVGAGGPAGSNNGSSSIFSTITSVGGGGGGSSGSNAGKLGGSGGGGAFSLFPNTTSPGLGTEGQGTSGSSGRTSGVSGGGGGGGAGTSGTLSSTGGGNGGNGLSSSITGSPVTRGGGGGGGNWDTYCGSCFLPGGSGGSGGGGQGAGGGISATPGSINTGGGGGGNSCNGSGPCPSTAGGSGIVVLRYPNTFFASFSAGVTQTTSPSGSNRVSTITATSTTSETVTFVRALDVSKTYHYINNDVNNPFIIGSTFPVGTTLSLYMQLRDVDGKNITDNNQVQSTAFWRSSCISNTSLLSYEGNGIYKIDLQLGGFPGCDSPPYPTSMNIEINGIDASYLSFTIV